MEEKIVKLVQGIHCDGKSCEKPLIPKGGGYVDDGHGNFLCLSCSEKPVLETRMTGALS